MKNWRNLFPHADKVAHFLAGFVIALIVTIIVKIPDYGFGAAFIAGLAKERYDHEVYGKGSYLDWFATIAGGALVWIIWINL
jgi:hypothetical protein